MKFNITIDRDEDGAWISECPSIPGCVSQGKTKEEAVENIKDAIALCLESESRKGAAFDYRDAAGRGRGVMPSLPVLSGQAVVSVFESFGWNVARQKSSHIIMTNEGEAATLSIP